MLEISQETYDALSAKLDGVRGLRREVCWRERAKVGVTYSDPIHGWLLEKWYYEGSDVTRIYVSDHCIERYL